MCIRDRTVVGADDDSFTIDLTLPRRAVTPGQSAVVYRGDVVAGGGVILSAQTHAAGAPTV